MQLNVEVWITTAACKLDLMWCTKCKHFIHTW